MNVQTERLMYSTGAADDVARRVPVLILLVFALDLLLAILFIGNYLVGHEYEPLTKFLDLDGEKNLPTWYSSVQWFCVAILLGLFARRHFEPKTLRSWALIMLPLIFLAMSLDEVARIHEWIGRGTDVLLPGGRRNFTMFRRTGIWMFVVGLPILLVITLLIYSARGYFEGHQRAFRKLLLGIAIVFSGALGIEALGNFVPRGSTLDMLTLLVEESLELFGATVVLWGSYELAGLPGIIESAAHRAP